MMTEHDLIEIIRARMSYFEDIVLNTKPPGASLQQVVIAESAYFREMTRRLSTDAVTLSALDVMLGTLRAAPVGDQQFALSMTSGTQGAVTDATTVAAIGVLAAALRAYALLTPPITDNQFAAAMAVAVNAAVVASAEVDLITPAAIGVLKSALDSYALLTPPITDRQFATGLAVAMKAAMIASADPDTVPNTAIDVFIAALAAPP